jgi:hypothetical protein
LNLNGAVGGVNFRDEDVLVFDQASGVWSILFDGSNVGLGNADVDAFAVLDNGNILLSVALLAHAPGLGLVDGADILEFNPSSLGPNSTVGEFQIYFDGSDVGLIPLINDVDAIDFDSEDNLLISVRGPFFAQGLRGNDEDLFRLNNAILGPNTSGMWELFFDGSAVGLATLREDTRDSWTDPATGEIYLTTGGNFRTDTDLRGGPADIFVCEPLSLGAATDCNFSLYFDGDSKGLSGKSIDSLHIGTLPSTDVAAAAFNATFDDTVERPGDDADPTEELDETSAPDEEEAIEQNNRVFLPVVTK